MVRRDSVLVSRTLYQMGIVTLVASIVWVAVGVYLTLTKTVVVEVDKAVIEPLVTKIDVEVVDQLTARLKIETQDELTN